MPTDRQEIFTDEYYNPKHLFDLLQYRHNNFYLSVYQQLRTIWYPPTMPLDKTPTPQTTPELNTKNQNTCIQKIQTTFSLGLLIQAHGKRRTYVTMEAKGSTVYTILKTNPLYEKANTSVMLLYRPKVNMHDNPTVMGRQCKANTSSNKKQS